MTRECECFLCLGVVGGVSGGRRSSSGYKRLRRYKSVGVLLGPDKHGDGFCLGEGVGVAIVSLVAVDDIFLAEIVDGIDVEDAFCGWRIEKEAFFSTIDGWYIRSQEVEEIAKIFSCDGRGFFYTVEVFFVCCEVTCCDVWFGDDDFFERFLVCGIWVGVFDGS